MKNLLVKGEVGGDGCGRNMRSIIIWSSSSAGRPVNALIPKPTSAKRGVRIEIMSAIVASCICFPFLSYLRVVH